jgi:bifunctional non-homologous end joining protein LigD
MPPRRSSHRSPARFLGFIEPCIPTERKTPPTGDDWLHEIKHDGYRAQAQFFDGAPRVFTRSGHEWAKRMPSIAASISALPVNNVILDGELVAVDVRGRPVFYELPAAITAKPTRVRARLVYFAFDLLYLDGFDLRGAALIDRKRVLEALLFNTRGVQLVEYVAHIEGDGAAVLEHACKLGLEGIVSKRATAVYTSGRARSWLKTKCGAWREANQDRWERLQR